MSEALLFWILLGGADLALLISILRLRAQNARILLHVRSQLILTRKHVEDLQTETARHRQLNYQFEARLERLEGQP